MKNAKKEVAEALASSTSTPANQISNYNSIWKPMTPDGLKLPQWDPAKYDVGDPLNPPASLPQISDQEFEAKSTIVKRAINAVKLTGETFDLYRERYNTEGKYYKAVASGVLAASEYSKLEGAIFDYRSGRESVSQKQIAMGLSVAQTQYQSELAKFSGQDNAEKLKQAQLKTETEQVKTAQAIANLKELKAQLGLGI